MTTDGVRAIRTALAAGQSQKEIAQQFGVQQGTISFIATGKTWRGVQ